MPTSCGCGRSGGGGKDVVVAVDMDAVGVTPEWRTRLTSVLASADQRSTFRTKKVPSISLEKDTH